MRLFQILVIVLWGVGCQTTAPEPEVKPPTEQEVSRSVQSVAVSLLNKGKPDLALKELRPYHVSHPEDAEIINLMGLSHLALKQPKVAEKLFRTAYNKKKDPAVALNLSSAYIQRKSWSRAVRLLKKLERTALPSYRHPERIYHNLGSAYAKQGKVALARRSYDKALTAYSEYLPSLLAKARLDMRMRRYPTESKRLIEKARQACPRCIQPVLLHALWLDRHEGRSAALTVIDAYAGRRMATAKEKRLAGRLKAKLEATPEPKVIAVKSLPNSEQKE